MFILCSCMNKAPHGVFYGLTNFPNLRNLHHACLRNIMKHKQSRVTLNVNRNAYLTIAGEVDEMGSKVHKPLPFILHT